MGKWYTVFTRSIQTFAGVANSVSPDKMAHSAVSDLWLHCLLRPVIHPALESDFFQKKITGPSFARKKKKKRKHSQICMLCKNVNKKAGSHGGRKKFRARKHLPAPPPPHKNQTFSPLMALSTIFCHVEASQKQKQNRIAEIQAPIPECFKGGKNLLLPKANNGKVKPESFACIC